MWEEGRNAPIKTSPSDLGAMGGGWLASRMWLEDGEGGGGSRTGQVGHKSSYLRSPAAALSSLAFWRIGSACRVWRAEGGGLVMVSTLSSWQDRNVTMRGWQYKIPLFLHISIV